MNNKPSISLEEIRNPNKIWQHLPVRQATELSGPISIEIQPTSACNLRCKWCSYWERNEFNLHHSRYIEREIIDDILSFCENHSVQSIYLAGGGEPCAYPYIHELVEKIHKLGIALAIITNGTLFARRLIDVAGYFSYLQVSIISSQREEYEAVTGSSKGYYEMQELPFRLKSDHGAKSPIIGGMYVITQWNYKNVFNVINFCQSKGFDYCSFRISVDYENRGVSLPDEVYKFLQKKLEEHQGDIDQHYTNLQAVLHAQRPRTYQPTQCLNTRYGLYAIVDTKGDVYLCVPDIGKSNFSLGSLKKQSLENIWNSQQHKRVVSELNIRYCDGECDADCRAHAYNFAATQKMPDLIPKTHSEFV